MKCIKVLLGLFMIVFAIAGCGGSGSGGGGSNQFAGAYRSDFLRGLSSDTTLLVVVQPNGNTSIVISDSTGVLNKGNGTTTSTGHLSGTATGSQDVNVTGTFTPGPTANTLSAQLSGGLTDTVSASQIANANVPPIVGTFTGTYSGDESGTFTIQIHSDGTVTGTVQSPSAGTITVSGTVNLAGAVTFNGSGSAGTASWTGSFFFVPNQSLAQGSGTWSNPSSSMSGTWHAQQS